MEAPIHHRCDSTEMAELFTVLQCFQFSLFSSRNVDTDSQKSRWFAITIQMHIPRVAIQRTIPSAELTDTRNHNLSVVDRIVDCLSTRSRCRDARENKASNPIFPEAAIPKGRRALVAQSHLYSGPIPKSQLTASAATRMRSRSPATRCLVTSSVTPSKCPAAQQLAVCPLTQRPSASIQRTLPSGSTTRTPTRSLYIRSHL